MVFRAAPVTGTKVLAGLGFPEGDKAKALVQLDQHAFYGAKHSVKLRADAKDKTLPAANGTVYGLCHS